jgi:gliding motility-associated protein GldM
LAARVIAPTSYVLQGQQYKEDIFLAAFNEGQNPEIFLGPIAGFKKNPDNVTYADFTLDQPVPPGYSATALKAEGGFGKYEATAAGVGEKTYTGVIRVKEPGSNKYKFYPFEQKYQTAPKAVVVSPSKMNVFYTGVDNPVEISVPGVSQNDVSATIDNGASLKKDPANPAAYIVNVSTLGKCNISVTAKIDGKPQSMGTKEFRVKRIPNPTPMTNTKATGGTIAVGTLKATGAIVAVLQDFDFDAHFTVTSFTFLLSSRGNATKIESNSGVFSQQMKQALETAKSKDIVIIDDIKAVGPDKVTRKIGQLAFTIQ